jgi:colanic acid/amylovoran biosynthesis protein
MKVLLLGNVDNNVGDDLILWAIIKKLSECEGIEIYLNTPKESGYGFAGKGVKTVALDYTSLNDAYNIIKGYDAIILAGGSLFKLNNFRITLHYIKVFLMLFFYKLCGKKLYLIGCNVGPITSKLGWIVVGLIFKIFNLVTVRDAFSYSKMKRFKKKNLYLAPDLAFLYAEDFKKYVRVRSPNALKLGVSVYNLRSEIGPRFLGKMANFIDLFLESPGREVVLFAFSTGVEKDQDACYTLKQLCKHKESIEICEYRGDFENFVSKLAECDVFIGIRFHSLILSLILNVPCLPISYSAKCENFLRDIGYYRFFTIEDFINTSESDIAVRLLGGDVLSAFPLKSYAEMSRLHLDLLVENLCKKNINF